MIHLDSYLYLSRHNIYYFRVVVPEGIGENLHKLEYRRSLQTRNPQTARTMARALRFCFEAQLARIRSNMTSWEDLRKILDKELDRILTVEREKLRVSGPYPLAADEIWNYCTIPGYRKAIQTISELRCVPKACLSPERIPEFAVTLADRILQTANINLDRSSDQFMQFCEATVKMYLEFTQQRIGLNAEAQSFRPMSFATIVPPQGITTNNISSKPISEVIEEYCNEMVIGGNWTLKTETEYRAIYKLLTNITNDMHISLIDYQVSQFFKSTLMKLPSNMNKKPLYRDKPVKDVAAMKIPKEDLLSLSKVNAYFSRISQLFTWACKNGYTKLNPFSGIGIKKKDVPDIEKRIPFEDSDLVALFSTPIFQEGKHLHPYYYWLPLLGLYTGARLDEMCQLHLEDIYQKGDLWVIDINAKGNKKLKNPSSSRVIPMHSRLIALGLLEYVTILRKSGQTRLFPELKKSRDGYSQAASKWFTRYRISCGVTDRDKTFHSFRHTTLDFFKQKKERKDISKAIVGHKNDDITIGLYGKSYEPSTLVSAIESLVFPIEVSNFVA